MIVKITNTRGGKIVFNWQIERDGEWRNRGFILQEFALAQEVSFIDEKDFDMFKRTFNDFFESGVVLTGKITEGKAQAKSEEVNNAEGKKLRGKSEKETEAMLDNVKKTIGDKANISVEVDKK